MSGQQTRTRVEVLAALVLTHAAERLGQVHSRMTDGCRDLAVEQAEIMVLDPVVGKWVRANARAAVLAVLPPVAGSTTEYADRLREIAGVTA